MKGWEVLLLVTAALTSCVPNSYGRGPAGQDIPFVWNAAVGTLPLEQVSESTSPDQHVTLPGCPRSATRLRYVRRYGVEAVQAACASALAKADQNARAATMAASVSVLSFVPLVIFFLILPGPRPFLRGLRWTT